MSQWASVIDAELLAVRARQTARLAAEHRRMADARQRIEDARIVAAREARIAAARLPAHVLPWVA